MDTKSQTFVSGYTTAATAHDRSKTSTFAAAFDDDDESDGLHALKGIFAEDPGLMRASMGGFRGSYAGARKRSRTLGAVKEQLPAGTMLSDSLEFPLLEGEDQEGEEVELDEHGNPIENEGRNGVPETILAFMKAFLGTAILFIPNGYKSGGMAGASGVILLCGCVATYCMHLLLDTKQALTEREGLPRTVRHPPASPTCHENLILRPLMIICRAGDMLLQ